MGKINYTVRKTILDIIYELKDDNGHYHSPNNDTPAYWNTTLNERIYYRHGTIHREGDLPAVEIGTTYKAYYKNGKLHRENGPAIIYTNQPPQYYLNGQRQEPPQ